MISLSWIEKNCFSNNFVKQYICRSLTKTATRLNLNKLNSSQYLIITEIYNFLQIEFIAVIHSSESNF